MKKQNKKQRTRKGGVSSVERISESATKWIGSTGSIIIHTIFFAGSFSLYFLDFDLNKILLVLTTVVSLEAIYLAIFIQMTVNRTTSELHAVSMDIDEIQEDVEEIQEDVEEIQKDVGELEEDFEEISEEIEKDAEGDKKREKEIIDRIEGNLQKLMIEIGKIKNKK